MGLDTELAIRHLHTRGFPKILLSKCLGDNAFDTIENDNERFLIGKDKVRRYSEQFSELPVGTGLVIIGQSGVGKSVLATAAVVEIFKTGSYSVRMTNVDEVIVAINNGWVHKEDAVLDIYGPRILVIDDFPQTLNQSRDVLDVIHKIYRQRYDKGKTTIITARCSKDNMDVKFGADFKAFLIETAIIVGDLDGSNDYRKKMRPVLR